MKRPVDRNCQNKLKTNQKDHLSTLLTFQLHYYHLQYMRTQLHQPILVRPSPSIPLIDRFKALDFQHRELLKLAEHIQASSFMWSNTPQMISRLEQQLKQNISGLLYHIREVFADMDRRLRTLEQNIEQTTRHRPSPFQPIPSSPRDNMQRQRQQSFYRHNHHSVHPYESLIERISSLESNLKSTQQNEAKLISIIQRLETRTEEQPTINSELKYQLQAKLNKDCSTRQIQKSRVDSLGSQNSFRLFAIGKNSTNQIHSTANIRRAEREPVSMTKKKQPESNAFFCLNEPEKDSIEPWRQPQMPALNFQKNYASTHSHRLNFMMNTLNS